MFKTNYKFKQSHRENKLEKALYSLEFFLNQFFVYPANRKETNVTHLSLNGGVFSIPRSSYKKFKQLYQDIERLKNQGLKIHPNIARYDTLCEAIYQQKDLFYYADLDFVLSQQLTKDQAVIVGKQFVNLVSKHIQVSFANPNLNYIILFSSKPKDSKFKNGFHIVFPELLMTRDQAKMIREETVNDWESEAWQFDIDKMRESFDKAVYNSGIRLAPSCKAEKLNEYEKLLYHQQLKQDWPGHISVPYYKFGEHTYKLIYSTKPEYDSMQSINPYYYGDTDFIRYNIPTIDMTQRGKELLDRWIKKQNKSSTRKLTEQELSWEKKNNLDHYVFSLFKTEGKYKNYKIKESCIEKRKDGSGCYKTYRKYVVECNKIDDDCGFCGCSHETPSFVVTVYEKDVTVICTRQLYRSNVKKIGKIPYVIYVNGITFNNPGYRNEKDYWENLINENNPLKIPYKIISTNTKEVPDLEPFDTYHKIVHAIHAATGREKTRRAQKYLEEGIKNGAKRVFAISGLRSVANKLSEQFGMVNYLRHDYQKSSIFDEDKLICSIESLWKVDYNQPFDIVVLDEIVFLLKKFGSETIQSSKLRTVWNVFIRIVVSSKQLVLMDADLDKAIPKLMQIVEEGYKRFPLSKPIDCMMCYVDNYVKSSARYEYVMGDFVHVRNLLESTLKTDENIAICCSHHDFADKMTHLASTIRKKPINDENLELIYVHGRPGSGGSKSELGVRFMTRPDETLSNCKTLVITPALINSISIENGRFKKIFCFARFGSIQYRDVLQQIARIRNVGTEPIQVFIAVYDTVMYQNTDKESILDSLDDKKRHYLQKAIFQEIVYLQHKIRDDLLSTHLVDIHIENVASNNNLKDNLIREIRESGAKLTYLEDYCKINNINYEPRKKTKRRSERIDKKYTKQKKVKKNDFGMMVVGSSDITKEEVQQLDRQDYLTIEDEARIKRKKLIDTFKVVPTAENIKKLSVNKNQQLALNALKMKDVEKSDMEELGIPEPSKSNWMVRHEVGMLLCNTLGFESLDDSSSQFTKDEILENIACFGELVRTNENLRMKLRVLDKKMHLNGSDLDQVKHLFFLCGKNLRTDKKAKKINGKVYNLYGLFDALAQ